MPHLAAVGLQLGNIIKDAGFVRLEKQDFTVRDMRGFRQDRHDRLADHGLARSGFAHQRHRLAIGHPKTHAVYCFHNSFRDPELNLEIPYQKNVGHQARLPSPRPSPTCGADGMMPRTARLARVTELTSTPFFSAMRKARRSSTSKSLIAESMLIFTPPPFSLNVIHPAFRRRCVE